MRFAVLFCSIVSILTRPADAANIGLAKTRDLNFATGTQNDSAATESSNSGNSNSSKYTVTGDAGKTYSVSFPAKINMTGPGANIQVNAFTSSSANAYTLDGTGKDTLYVGATRAALPAGQATGSYTGNFQATVQYTSGGKSAKAWTASNLTVIATIAVSKTSDLTFGEAAAGTAAKTINPASDSGRATFTVSGQPSTAYTITLPADGATTMSTGGGGANKTIAVDSFASSPTSPATLPVGGNQTLYVGATRAALPEAQVAGAYSGSFTVTVTYQ